MRIGVDISQIAFESTGVAAIVKNLIKELIILDEQNQYILFYSSLRRNFQPSVFNFSSNKNFTVKKFRFPPIFLDILWNRLHVVPIEWLIGPVDVFLSSDWVQPPTVHAKKATILYDLIVYKYPEETHDKFKFSLRNLRIMANIVASQKRRLKWVKKEADLILCISNATKKDAIKILRIPEDKLQVIYPGM